MQQNTEVPNRGLRRNAVGLSGLVAQSLGVTAPEISAVVIASVVAAKVAGATPFAFLIAGVGALGLAVIYGRFARHVPNAGGTYAIVRAGLGRDAGFLSGWVVLAVGVVFVPALLIAAGFLLQNFFGLVAPGATAELSRRHGRLPLALGHHRGGVVRARAPAGHGRTVRERSREPRRSR